MINATRPEPVVAGEPAGHRERQGRPGRRVGHPAVVVVLLAGVALRFYCPSPLWLDEAISVNISRLPLAQIPQALRQDGAPPLYYVLLHGWMALFGQGDIAVRTLSGVASVLTLPLLWYAGRRVGGRRVATIALVLGATSPFALAYATEARMYSLLVLEVTLGFLAVCRALERPSRGRLAALVAVTASVLYTHYWGLYLVAVTGAWLVGRLARQERPERRATLRCLTALVLGGLLFVPWVPIFVFQAQHTGTPWTSPARVAALLGVFADFAGTGPWARLLAYAYCALLVLGALGCLVRPGGGAEVGSGAGLRWDPVDLRGEADLLGSELLDVPLTATRPLAGDELAGGDGEGRGAGMGAGVGDRVGQARHPGVLVPRTWTLIVEPNRRAQPTLGILVGTLVLAVLAGMVNGSAFVARYTAVVLPLFLLVAALGLALLSDRRLVAGAVAVVCLAGLLTGYGNNGEARTASAPIARVLDARARPGDLVVYCPDQLGPASSRLLTVPGLAQLSFPRANGPQRVDWVDYRQVIDQTDIETFAQDMVARVATGHVIWLVSANYPGFGTRCEQLAGWLTQLDGPGATLVHTDLSSSEHRYTDLVAYPPIIAPAQDPAALVPPW